jgi:protein-glutamine gamma-glutamyltransferase
MRTPALLMGAALLFWGWQTGFPSVAGTLAILLEAARLFRWRWDFSDKDFNRIWDLCALLFVGAFVYRYTAEEPITSAFAFFQWFPILFFPMALGQAYSARETIPLSTFSWFMRLTKPSPFAAPVSRLNVSWAYFAICLLAAGAANRREVWFYVALTFLCGWAFWAARPRRLSPVLWAGSFLAAAGIGYFGQLQLNQLQNYLEGAVSGWFAKFGRRGFDAYETRTAMGQIGSLKQSGRIVLRVEPEGQRMPHLLRQASYDFLRQTTWLATKKDFEQVLPEADTTSWILLTNKSAEPCVRVYSYLKRGRGLLSLPLATTQVQSLPVSSMETSPLGVVRIREGPGLLNYRALIDPGSVRDAEPDTVDLHVPERESAVLEKIVRDLRLRALPDVEKLRVLEQFFQAQFKYSLYVPENQQTFAQTRTALGRFLTETRAGHCEYFASAAVLLLRKAGLPARYATGYAVQETDRKGNTYIVRDRHAHAWAIVHLGGVWQDFDATPASWNAAEEQQASAWEPFQDFGSQIWFYFSKWRYLGEENLFSTLAPWLIAPLALILVWRLFLQKKRTRRNEDDRVVKGRCDWPGLDSEVYTIERKLAARGLARLPGETLQGWLHRCRAAGLEFATHSLLQQLLILHYRYRFDPAGLSKQDRAALRQQAAEWLKTHSI